MNARDQSDATVTIPIIGLLGGVASGKSLVAKQLQDLGAGLLDGDRTGHEVLRLPEVVQAVRGRWGDCVLDAQGEVDRSRLAQIVFGPPPDGPLQLKHLERLTHPKIGDLLRQKAREMSASGQFKALVLDAPLMLEAGWHSICDYIVYVDAPLPARQARAMARGWTAADLTAREAEQESLDAKRKHADIIIDNSGSAEFTRSQVERFWHSLVR